MLHNIKKNMLRARCLAYAVRALFSEILLGIYTDLEIVDTLKNNDDYNVEQTEEGDVIVIKSKEEN